MLLGCIADGLTGATDLGVALAREKGDNGTKELLEHHLKSEESSVDWLEAQLYLVEQVGVQAYLAEQMKD